MKSQIVFRLSYFFLALLFSISLSAQNTVSADSTGFPGDGFSLEGALELFKKAKSPEGFEKALNSEDNAVNNLDLNEDGEVDYIRVVDNKNDKAHAIVLQVPLNDKESQDIAVIGIEEEGKERAVLQIIGDADVYGEETIVEPFDEETESDGNGGPSADDRIVRIVVNVYFWPCVRFIYRPSYVVYVSPWRWHYYPTYWRPWRPKPWHVCHSRRVVYHRHYHHTRTHRVVHAHKVYTPHRRTSAVVQTRTTTVKAVKGPKGNTAVKKTTTTKTVNTKNRNTATTKSSTTKVTKANTANNKASTANKKANTANNKASTANKKANTANNKTSTANKKANTANNKASTANKKASTANKKASTANKKSTAANKKTQQKSAKPKTSTQKSRKKGNAAGGNKTSKSKSSHQKSRSKSGGGKKKGNR